MSAVAEACQATTAQSLYDCAGRASALQQRVS